MYWQEGVYYSAAGVQKTPGFSQDVVSSQELGQHSPEEYRSILQLLNMKEVKLCPRGT